MIYVIVILAGMWVYSFVRFRRRYRVDRMLCEFTRKLFEADPFDSHVAVEYGCALMLSQQYQSALKIFESVKRMDADADHRYPFLDANIEFCKKPLPWSRGAKDYKNGSWWHNFQLARFGCRRRVAISNDTALAFNSMLRKANRQ